MITINKVKESELNKVEQELQSKLKAQRKEKLRSKTRSIVSVWHNGFRKISKWGRRLRGRYLSYVKIDVFEANQKYRLLVDIPGVTEETVSVDLSDKRLVITCTRAESVRAVYRERMTGKTRRTFWFDKEIDSDTCHMKVEAGVLEIEIDQANDTKNSMGIGLGPNLASAKEIEPVVGLRSTGNRRVAESTKVKR